MVKLSLSGSIHAPKGFVKKFPFNISVPVTMKPNVRALIEGYRLLKGVITVKGRPDAASKPLEVQMRGASGSACSRADN